MSLDWQTDENDPEETRPRPAGNETALSAAGSHWQRIGCLLVFAGIALPLVALVYYQVARRATEAASRIEAEVMASHQVVLQASEDGDIELFAQFLSGADDAWATSQKQLVRGGGLDARPGFGSRLPENGARDETSTDLELNAVLTSAGLSTPVHYEVDTGDGVKETVTLQQVSIFQKVRDRWLLSPPDEAFWGQIETIEGRLQHAFPARDAKIVGRLASDLDAIMPKLCDKLPQDCGHLAIEWSTEPVTLLEFSDSVAQLGGGAAITLPTPTLFGMPVDEAAYRAVFRAYASRVVNAVSANYAGWSCCRHALVYAELQEAQLSELGLRSWASLPGSFERLAVDPLSAAGVWRSPTVTQGHASAWPGHALVEFLTSPEDHMPIPEMQRALFSGADLTYQEWLIRVTKGKYATYDEVERGLLSYAARRRVVKQPPVPLPEQDLQLICRSSAGLRPALFRYDLTGMGLSFEREFRSTREPVIVALPSRDGIAVSGMLLDDQTLLPGLIIREGQERPIEITSVELEDFIPLPPKPWHQSLLFYQDTRSRTHLYSIAPVTSCLTGEGCSSRPLFGPLVFSPDNRHTVITIGGPVVFPSAHFQPVLYLGDAGGWALRLIGPGSSPFWLDEDTFGYLRLLEDGTGQAVVVHDVIAGSAAGSGPESTPVAVAQNVVTGGTRNTSPSSSQPGPSISEPRQLFTGSDLEAMPYRDPALGTTIDRVLASPNSSELFVITARPDFPSGRGLVASYDLTDDQLRNQFSFSEHPANPSRVFEISPNGDWLVVGALQAADAPEQKAVWTLYLHGIAESTHGQTLVYRLASEQERPASLRIDWSAEDQWLAVATNGYIRLIAPAAGYTLPLIFDDVACTSGVWINEE